MAITYPSNDLQQRANLLALLGSHWSSIFEGRELVGSHCFARGQQEIQNYLNLLETVDSLSRLNVPIFHRSNWYLLTILESDMNQDPARFGDGYTFDSGIHYGTPPPGIPGFTFPVPEDLHEVPVIFNRITTPSRTLLAGVDYELDTDLSRITFNSNPFDDSLMPVAEQRAGNTVTDREIGLWVYRGGIEQEHIYTHFGYLLNLHLVSSEAYRDIVNAILDAFVQGTSAVHVNLALSALTGVPVVQESQETVELITTDHNHLVICTDQHCYQFDSSDSAVVSVGDTVTVGQFLTSAVSADELNRGVIPSGLYSLVTGPETLGGEFAAGLSWVNEDVPVQVEPDVDGRTKISWQLGGFPTDIELFWAEVHARGVADGTTLANLLDVRRI